MTEKLTDKDKLLHMAVCFLIALYSTEASFTAALAKEYGDKNASGNHWCWMDILADTIGMLVGTAVRLVILASIHHGFVWNWF